MLWYVYLADKDRLLHPMFVGHLAYGPPRDIWTMPYVAVIDALDLNQRGKPGELVFWRAERVFIVNEAVRFPV